MWPVEILVYTKNDVIRCVEVYKKFYETRCQGRQDMVFSPDKMSLAWAYNLNIEHKNPILMIGVFDSTSFCLRKEFSSLTYHNEIQEITTHTENIRIHFN